MSTVISFAPVTTRLRQRVSPGAHPLDAAVERVELSPAIKSYSQRAISLPGESERATGTMPHTTVQEIRDIEPEGEYSHGATLTFRLDDALIADGCIYSRGRYLIGRPGPRRPVLVTAAEEFSEAQLSSDVSSEIYFGHWLCDGLCTELLALDRSMSSLIYQRPVRLHEAGYRELVDVYSQEIRVAQVKKLWVVDDRGINANRAERFRQLRSRLSNHISKSPDDTSPYVFITRGAWGTTRELTNEPAIIEALAKLGFDVIDPMLMSPRLIAERLAQAKVVIGVEGSHQSHALLAMPAGGAVLTIQPPQRFLHSWKFFCDLADLRYGFTVADAAGEEGFTLGPDRLVRTLDLVMAEL